MDLMIQMDSIHTMDLATKPIGPWTSHRIHRPKPGIIIGSSSSVNNLAGDVERSWFFVDGMGSSWLKPWKLTMITMDVDGITWTNDDSICFCLFFFPNMGDWIGTWLSDAFWLQMSMDQVLWYGRSSQIKTQLCLATRTLRTSPILPDPTHWTCRCSYSSSQLFGYPKVAIHSRILFLPATPSEKSKFVVEYVLTRRS